MVKNNLQSLGRKALLTESLSDKLRKIPDVGWVAPIRREDGHRRKLPTVRKGKGGKVGARPTFRKHSFQSESLDSGLTHFVLRGDR